MKSLKLFFLVCGLVLVLTQFASAIDKPYEGISADELMSIKYYIKHTKFAQDYQSTGHVWLITKGGFKRHRTPGDRERDGGYRYHPGESSSL